MSAVHLTSLLSRWTVWAPLVAMAALVLSWGRDLPLFAVVLVALCLAGAVLAAVHHAEVVAHRVGEPFGSLELAVAVTVIEVALIVTIMIDGGPESASLARDIVFAAVMITCNGIVGLSLLVAALRNHVAVFNAEGSGAALATVATLATLSLSATAGEPVFSVFGVATGSAAENGTFHSCAAGTVDVSRRQNRSNSSAPRLPVSTDRSQRSSTPHASARPSPPAHCAHARTVSATARSAAGTRFANCCRCRSPTLSRPRSAIAATSSIAPRVRSERGVPTVPKTRS
ncbi:hypothetical protein ACWD01_07160 [Streptomyces sp. NPDC002835]